MNLPTYGESRVQCSGMVVESVKATQALFTSPLRKWKCQVTLRGPQRPRGHGNERELLHNHRNRAELVQETVIQAYGFPPCHFDQS